MSGFFLNISDDYFLPSYGISTRVYPSVRIFCFWSMPRKPVGDFFHIAHTHIIYWVWMHLLGVMTFDISEPKELRDQQSRFRAYVLGVFFIPRPTKLRRESYHMRRSRSWKPMKVFLSFCTRTFLSPGV